MKLQRVTVYCASSRQAHSEHAAAARRLGEILATEDVTVVYGGGAVGSMGALADGALDAGGSVIGIMPHFMQELEWGHQRLTELRLVDDMADRKRRMIEGTDAVVALPGGTGTFEELFETMTLKRLGQFLRPIVLVNVRGAFDPLVRLLETAVEDRFLDARHRDLWTVVSSVDDVVQAIVTAPGWDEGAVHFAGL